MEILGDVEVGDGDFSVEWISREETLKLEPRINPELRRGALLNGESLSSLSSDIAFLIVFAAIALPLSLIIFQLGVDRTRRTGTLTQY